MSKNLVAILFAAVLLIVLATVYNSTFVAGGSGIVLVVTLGYAYVVSKRESERRETGEA